jgi:Bifunctional DNA primase/polymerase, N-terminal
VSIPKTQPANNPHKLLDHALEYAARGWSIIPVIGKRAAGLWRPFQERRADEPTLRKLFGRQGITGLAVILGSASGGLACRDFDDAGAYDRWTAEHPDLAATLPTVATARGFHIYFRGPDGFRNLGDGEYRGDAGHYCLLPPSGHPDGHTYTWSIPLPSGELPLLDPEKTGLLTQADSRKTQANTAYTLHVSDEFSAEIENSILATLPTGPGKRNRQLFALARRLKAIMPDATMDALEVIVRAWHTRALPVIRTQEWLESWIDFRTAWAKVKRPIGATMAEIVTAAKAQTPADADAIAKLVNLCRAMQKHHGPGRAWSLSCRMAATIIGTGHDTAARLLKMLAEEGTIQLATKAGPKGSSKAAEYRFLGVQP